MSQIETIRQEILNSLDATEIDLHFRDITRLPPEIGQLKNLQSLYLSSNCLTRLPPEIGQLKNLQLLNLSHNRLTHLPPEIEQLKNLQSLHLNDNPIQDLSGLGNHSSLWVNLFDIGHWWTDQYWTHLSQWKAEWLLTEPNAEIRKLLIQKIGYGWKAKWLLTESNAEIRKLLIQKIGYDRICQELHAVELNSWREYTLLRINADVDMEPIHLLKMICPSTAHIHTLRVPPTLISAREAIRWVNWGIDPETFAAKT